MSTRVFHWIRVGLVVGTTLFVSTELCWLVAQTTTLPQDLQKVEALPPAVGHPPKFEVFFSPKGGCTDAIVRELSRVRRGEKVRIQAYSFTSPPIAKAAVKADREQGAEVIALLDSTNKKGKYSEATFLANGGVETLIDGVHSIAHNKVIIIGEREVITGSFNFSRAAEADNAENVIIIRDPAVAKRYVDNWELHFKHSQPYVSPAQTK
jgi:phosphatidylserine/phosphatidylglycerophosphate/cardiolipin synthase-like enzyme